MPKISLDGAARFAIACYIRLRPVSRANGSYAERPALPLVRLFKSERLLAQGAEPRYGLSLCITGPANGISVAH
jgi:hypothetical protein